MILLVILPVILLALLPSLFVGELVAARATCSCPEVIVARPHAAPFRPSDALRALAASAP